ncbi:MAG: hypothetical protein HYV38_01665 [Candidatus Levybacteria bacterium]|nr:hypothetical protein [Candidatus Levybacteria bacterium]MBI2420769.1 hypothetical protein [Candidatus Levybacteria bacterium]
MSKILKNNIFIDFLNVCNSPTDRRELTESRNLFMKEREERYSEVKLQRFTPSGRLGFSS